MVKPKKDSWFTIVTLVLVALILGEIGFLGYQFWFRDLNKSQEGTPVVVPPLSLPPSPAAAATEPLVKLVFGWLEGIAAEGVILRTEEDQLVTFPLSNQTEFFSFSPPKMEEAPLSLFTFFDSDFQARSEVESLTREEINPGLPAYLVVERTADDLFLGKRLVVIRE